MRTLIAATVVILGTLVLLGESGRSQSTAVAPASATNPTESRTDRRYDSFPLGLERPTYHALSGKVVGILYPAHDALTAEAWMGVPEDAVGFGIRDGEIWNALLPSIDSNPSRARWVTEAVPGKEPSAATLPNAIQTTSDKVPSFGLHPPFTLAEVEVNGGTGAKEGGSFVTTNIRVLQKTALYPLDPDVIMRDATARFKIYKESQTTLVDKAMRELEAKTLGERKATGPREAEDILYITWLPDSERIRIRYWSVTADGAYKYGHGLKQPTGGHGDMNRGMIPDLSKTFRYGTQFGVEESLVLEYAKDGTFKSQISTPLKDFSEELPRSPVE